MGLSRSWLTLLALAVPGLASAADPTPAGPPVDYGRDIKPLLAARCYACHGPDESKRKAHLRLDLREEAVREAITPGDPAGSSLVERIASDDPHEVMPPPASKKERLTKGQIDLFRRWIAQGAKFDVHWAYVKPVRPPLPAVARREWVRNPIDYFIAAGHEANRFSPSPEADRVTLVRRLSFDLTGLPPTPAEVQAFLGDSSPTAYDRVVERLLGSKHHGERMALYWLDLVRFADTGGYHSDNHRDVTLYRDYVIDAFNANKRFDQFTVEQLAGDLLPNPTREQKTASGYNRLLMTTEEGGAQPKEYQAKYAADRVRNVSVVWLAGTLGCAECHNHKFDPYTTKDFYSLAAFFADIQEKAVGRQDQDKLPTPEQIAELARVDRQITEAEQALHAPNAQVDAAQAQWEETVTLAALRKLPKNLVDALLALPAKRTAEQKQLVARHYHGLAPLLEPQRQRLAELRRQREQIDRRIPTTLVSTSGTPRMMRVLPRGNWLDDSGEVVTPATPAFLPPLDVKGRQPNRLDLARWLVAPDHPLVARVFVNRLWKLMFGQGLVRSVDDFGAQGEVPSHPQLLDWLAIEFVERGWDVKHLLRLIATSSAYRQSSVAHRDLRERDPANRWLARQGRFRLDAEMVRDNALAVSGLLADKIGGPSAKPYQPDGYWQYLNFPKRDYHPDHGADQYRRGLYTYWQRTLPHPSLIAFDAPSREECTADRPRSSTPLQALVLLNDPTYVEAARVLAERILREGGASPGERIGWAFRRVLSRGPRPDEEEVLTSVLHKHLGEFAADAEAARKLVRTGEWPLPKDQNVAELAAWTSVARVLLNLHETITRN